MNLEASERLESVSRETAEWLISTSMWRMYNFGKNGNPVSAQCEVQHLANLLKHPVQKKEGE